MDASLDTDIVIHLYKSEKRDLLFLFTDKLYMHEYLVEHELKKISHVVYREFLKDARNELITIINTSDLINMGVNGLFESYLRDYNYLFDMGEVYAVALAKAMGLAAFLSNDTKEFGPHDTLVKELIEDVIPFSFYELLFVKFLECDMNPEELFDEFQSVNINSLSQRPMDFRTKMLLTVRRFSNKYGTERDKQWINDFCESREINYNLKMIELRDFLKNCNYLISLRTL